MGAYASIVMPSLETPYTIAERWSTKLKDRPIEEKANMVIQMLDVLINGVYCGLNGNLDYVFLVCEEPTASELCDMLKKSPELEGIYIEVNDHQVFKSYKPGNLYSRGHVEYKSEHGIEIRSKEKVVPPKRAELTYTLSEVVTLADGSSTTLPIETGILSMDNIAMEVEEKRERGFRLPI